MSEFNTGAFNEDLFGFPYKLGRGHVVGVGASSAVGVVRKRVTCLVVGTASTALAPMRRRGLLGAQTTGYSVSSLNGVRRKIIALRSVGKSNTQATSVRRRGYLLIKSLGTSRTYAASRRKLYSVMWVSTGTGSTTALLVKLALPPPARDLRTAAWTRPVMGVNLRFQRWTSR